MDNIFETGGIVTGESLIGYERHLSKCEECLLQRRHVSITGLPRFGKTSIAKEIMKRVKDKDNKIVSIFITLNELSSFSELQKQIIKELLKELDASNCKDVQDCKEQLEKLKKLSPDDYDDYKDDTYDIFESLNRKGYRLILILDEFDTALNLFDCHHFGIIFKIGSEKLRYGVSIVTISRRQLANITAKHTQNSPFDGLFHTIPIEGFNKEDIKSLYYKLSSHYNIELSQEAQKLLNNYCGRSPYLSSLFAYELANIRIKSSTNDKRIIIESDKIEEIHEQLIPNINKYYKHIIKFLMDDANDNDCLNKLIDIIICPDFRDWKKEKSEFISLGYLFTDDSSATCTSISNDFTNYIIDNHYKSHNTWKAYEILIKRIRGVITEYVKHNYRSGNNESFRKFYKDKKLYFYSLDERTKKIDSKAQKIPKALLSDPNQNGFCDFLTCLNDSETCRIVKKLWESCFASYFNNKEWKDWEKVFETALHPIIRGFKAHCNDEKLKAQAFVRWGIACDIIINQMAQREKSALNSNSTNNFTFMANEMETSLTNEKITSDPKETENLTNIAHKPETNLTEKEAPSTQANTLSNIDIIEEIIVSRTPMEMLITKVKKQKIQGICKIGDIEYECSIGGHKLDGKNIDTEYQECKKITIVIDGYKQMQDNQGNNIEGKYRLIGNFPQTLK